MVKSLALCAGAAAIAAWALAAPTVQALTLKECSEKYRAAQAAGTAKGLKWNDFRKTECGSTASAAPTPTPGAAAPTAAPGASTPSAQPAAPKRAERAPRPATTTGVGSPGDAAFPTAVSPKYSNETPGRARMHTC